MCSVVYLSPLILILNFLIRSLKNLLFNCRDVTTYNITKIVENKVEKLNDAGRMLIIR